MDERVKETAARLRSARQSAGFKTAKDAAEAFGWPYPTYKAHESGTRGLKTEAARQYAAAFGTQAAWLLTGETSSSGPPQSIAPEDGATRRVPILDWSEVSAYADDGGVEVGSHHPSVPLADKNVGPRAFALVVEDRAMLGPSSDGTSFRPGDIVILDPDRKIEPGDFVAVAYSEDAPAVLRKYRPRGRDQHNREVAEFVPINEDYPTRTEGPFFFMARVVLQIRSL